MLKSDRHPILYPSKPSEFEVQASLYNALKNAGLDVRGEVKVSGRRKLGVKYRGARFDLVVYQGKVPVILIEVKKSLNAKSNTNQLSRYREWGYRVMVCAGMERIPQTISYVLDYMRKTP
jgi:hypothetical protein